MVQASNNMCEYTSTVFISSLYSGHLECVKWLIANRASLLAEDGLGRTALDLAEEYQHKEVATFIRKCIDEAHDPNSSLHALRSNSRKG